MSFSTDSVISEQWGWGGGGGGWKGERERERQRNVVFNGIPSIVEKISSSRGN